MIGIAQSDASQVQPPMGQGALCALMRAPALINIHLLAPPTVTPHLCCGRTKKHVKTRLELNTAYSCPQGYYSNSVKALGKSTAPAAEQWGEAVAGGGM